MRKIYMKDVVLEKIDTRRWIAGAVDTNGCSWEICEAETKAKCVALARKAVKRFNTEEAQKAQEAEATAIETTPATEQTQEVPTQEAQTTEAQETTPATETTPVPTQATQTQETETQETGLQKIVEAYKDDFQDGIAWMFIWKENGKFKVFSTYSLDSDFIWINKEDKEEIESILKDHKDTVVINGYQNACDSDDINEIIERVKYIYGTSTHRAGDILAVLKLQDTEDKTTYTDADAQSIAASLIDGGWTSEDAEEIQEAYSLTLGQARRVVEAMQAYEQEAKAERINAIIDDLNNLEEELMEVAEEIAEDCEAEGYPSNGSNFELRYGEEADRINSLIDELYEEAEGLGVYLKYIEGVWRETEETEKTEENEEMGKEIVLIEDNRQDCDTYEYVTYSITLGSVKVGTCSIMESEEEPQHLERIDIDEQYRGKGYGSQVLKKLKGLYDEYTVAPDNEDAARLYARLGEEYGGESADFLDEGFGVYLI